jgi:carboxypeptidase D
LDRERANQDSHYGPAFFNYFYEQNQKIADGSVEGIHLDFNSLGIINGIIDEAIQAPHYPEFAVNNTYGIKAVRTVPPGDRWTGRG